jgi:hypothetical protein
MKWYVNILEETVIQVAQFYYLMLYLFSNFYGDHRTSFEIRYFLQGFGSVFI